MNIGVFTHYFTPEIGAPSARVHEMAREWVAMGHEVQVATCFPNHPAGQVHPGYAQSAHAIEMLDGIRVHRNWSYITPNRGFFRKTLGHASFLASSWRNTLPRMDRPDVVVGTSPTFFAAMAARAAGHRFRVPFIMEVRDLWPACFVDLGVIRNRMLIRMLEVWEMSLYRSAAHIVTVTSSFKDNLVSRGIAESKVTSLPNGADTDFWTPRPRSGRLAEGVFKVLYLGAHGISQALKRVLEAARMLGDEPGYHFYFVGDGAEKEMLQAYVREHGMTNVRFMDPVDKRGVRELYADADACLVPLRDIPLFATFIPSKMFEIMAMGRPIVASVGGEAAGILRESGGAIVVPPEDSAAMAAAIRRLRREPGLGAALGERGRGHVVRAFSRTALARRYVETMDGVVAGAANRFRGV